MYDATKADLDANSSKQDQGHAPSTGCARTHRYANPNRLANDPSLPVTRAEAAAERGTSVRTSVTTSTKTIFFLTTHGLTVRNLPASRNTLISNI